MSGTIRALHFGEIIHHRAKYEVTKPSKKKSDNPIKARFAVELTDEDKRYNPGLGSHDLFTVIDEGSADTIGIAYGDEATGRPKYHLSRDDEQWVKIRDLVQKMNQKAPADAADKSRVQRYQRVILPQIKGFESIERQFLRIVSMFPTIEFYVQADHGPPPRVNHRVPPQDHADLDRVLDHLSDKFKITQTSAWMQELRNRWPWAYRRLVDLDLADASPAAGS